MSSELFSCRPERPRTSSICVHTYVCACVCEYEQKLRSSHTLIDSARKSRQSKDALKHTLRFWVRNFGSIRISEYLGIWCVYICLSGVMDNGLPHIYLGIPVRIYKYRYGFACQVECRSVYSYEWCGYRDSGAYSTEDHEIMRPIYLHYTSLTMASWQVPII